MDPQPRFDPDCSSSGGGSCSSDGGGDIFQKISAILDNKLDLSNLLDDGVGGGGGYGGRGACESSSSSSLSPNSNVFYPSSISTGRYGGGGDKTNILGLSGMEAGNANAVKTFQYGEFKFPDVSSPLNKILSGHGGGASNSRLREIDSSFGLQGFGALGQSDAPRGGFGGYNSGSSDGSPALEEASLLATRPSVSSTSSSRFEFARSNSPDSDAGYGTSYGSSALSSGSGGGGRGQGPGTLRHEERELQELLKCLNISGQGSPSTTGRRWQCGGGSGRIPPNPAAYEQESAHNVSSLDPTVAQAMRNLHALQQQQQQFAQYIARGGGGGGSTAYSSGMDYPNNASSGEGYAGNNGSPSSLEKAARIHRNGTAVYDASCTWSGQLPQRNMRNMALSCKVFLGGVPWDITESALFNAFKPFGQIRIEWPGKDNTSIPKGYLYVIFENEKQVKALLNACTHDYGNGGSWYLKISSRRMRNKEVQVIPWVISDSNFVRYLSPRLDPQKTVFVGALHGMLTAEGLCNIFNDLFGGVVYAGVDTDKYKYPIGSGRVTFNNNRSYMKAVSAAFIEIKTSKFTKKVQVDPYLEDALCSSCGLRQGPYFCRDVSCFNYFCRSCWETHHVGEYTRHHKPLMRNSKSSLMNGGGGFMRHPSAPHYGAPPAPMAIQQHAF